MKKLLTKGQIALLVIFSVLIIDQVIKIWIKTHMYWHESIRITDWFYIYFTENNGMAFGMEIFGKLFLTTFRIVAVGLIGWYLYKIVKRGLKTGYIICVSLILTGALGNIIDSVFYGTFLGKFLESYFCV
jgi:signal peptidase II